jgi:hypothetical protein
MCMIELRHMQHHSRVIRSAYVSTHHEPHRNRNTVTTILEQEIQIALLWIEENSYYISTSSLQSTTRT